MSLSVHIDHNIAEGLKGLKPEAMRQAIATGMTKAGPYLVASITKERLTGNPGRPYPVESNRLRSITGRLRASLRSTPAQIEGNDVSITIGSAVSYAAAHEFGFSGNVTIPAHTRQRKGGVAHTVRSHQRAVTIPERRPVRTGISTNLNIIGEEISTAVLATMSR